MTMKKQILLFSLALLSVTASAYDAKIDGIYYNFSETEATVTYFKRNSSYSNYNKSAYLGSVVIPEYVSYNEKMYSVTSIGEYAFSACSDLTSVNSQLCDDNRQWSILSLLWPDEYNHPKLS